MLCERSHTMRDNHIKRGTVREDGKMFWVYKNNKEIWINKEQYDKRENTRREYNRKCRANYVKRQLAKHPVHRNFVGKYDVAKNLYFSHVSCSGKEVWISKEQLEKRRKRNTIYRRRMYHRLKEQHPITGLKIGDPNPSNPKEYVIFFIGNKPYFGSKSQLAQRQEGRAISYRKRNEKYKKIREEKLKNLEKRIRRGTVHPETGLVFFYYAQNGNERWVTNEFYQNELEKERQSKKRLKEKQYIKSCEGLKNIST